MHFASSRELGAVSDLLICGEFMSIGVYGMGSRALFASTFVSRGSSVLSGGAAVSPWFELDTVSAEYLDGTGVLSLPLSAASFVRELLVSLVKVSSGVNVIIVASSFSNGPVLYQAARRIALVTPLAAPFVGFGFLLGGLRDPVFHFFILVAFTYFG